MTTTGPAVSNQGAYGLGIESSFGSAASITDWIPAVSDGLNSSRPRDVSSAIFHGMSAKDSVRGNETAGGNLVIPAYGGVGYGRLLKLATRSLMSGPPCSITVAPTAASYSVPQVTSKPTVAEGSAGLLPAGTYYYQAAEILQHTASGLKVVTPKSPDSDPYTADGTKRAVVSFVVGGTPPAGWTYYGTAIYRTSASPGSETLYGVVVGAGTSFTDNGDGVAPTGLQAFSIPGGDYRYKAALVLEHQISKALYATNWSPSSTPIPVSNIGVTLTLTLPEGPPIGFSIVGVAIARSAPGGAAGTEVPYDYQAGTGTTWRDLSQGSTSTGSTLQADMYGHILDKDDDVQPGSATILKHTSNGSAEQYVGARVNQAQFSVKPGERLTSTFDFFCQTMSKAAEGTPAYGVVNGFHGRKSYAWLQAQGTAFTPASLINAFDVTLNNKLIRKYNISGGDKIRESRAPRREVKGSFDFDFESTEQLDNFLNDQDMSLYVQVLGPSGVPPMSFGSGANKKTIKGFPYLIAFYMPCIQYDSHAAALNADAAVVQKLPFTTVEDPTVGSECQIEFYTTATTL